ncbi:MAG: hypothetical protein WAK17_03890 [Candidatus Nitrosopolaris sp.]|jgi:hypothetical protein
MSFSGLSGSTSQFKVKIIGAANNPCVSPSPDIDYNGTIIVTVLSIQESNDDVKIDFSGLVPFPGFETYWSADDIVVSNLLELFDEIFRAMQIYQ